MKAGSVLVRSLFRTMALGILVLLVGQPAWAQTPDATCSAGTLNLVSPDEIELELQALGRFGMMVSWPDLDLSQATCFVLTSKEGTGFEAEVTGGYGGMVDRSFVFSPVNSGGVIGSDQAEKLVYTWKSDGPSFYGSVGGILNLANNGGLWRYDQSEGVWGQLNHGLPMTWMQNNFLALAESEDGAVLGGFSSGSTVGTSPTGLWIFTGGSWSQLCPDIFNAQNLITQVAFAPGGSSTFAVGTSKNGLYLTMDGGTSFTNWTADLFPECINLPTTYNVSMLKWSEARLMVFIPFFGLFISDDDGASFTRSDIEVIRNLDKPQAIHAEGGHFGVDGEILRMRGEIEMEISGTGQLGFYNREMTLPIVFEFHVDGYTPGPSEQEFDIELMKLEGRITGDADFDTLRIAAGDSLFIAREQDPYPASLGSLTLIRQSDGKFQVEGDLDVHYEVKLDGKVGGPFEGLSGLTTGNTLFVLGDGAVGEICNLADNGFGTIALPPQCDEGFLGNIQLTEGMPSGATLEIAAHVTGYQENMLLPMVNELLENPTDSDHLLAAVNFHGILESDDGGYTWHCLAGDLIQPMDHYDEDRIDGDWVHNALSVAVDPTDKETMVIGLRQEGIYRTVNGGLNWIEVAGSNLAGTVQPANLGALLELSIRADLDHPGIFYALEDKWALLVSSDYGATWEKLEDQPVLNTAKVFEVAQDGSGDLVVGTWGGGTYVPGSPLALSSTYSSFTSPYLRDTLDLGLDISFSAGVVADADSLYLTCQTFQGWAVWRASGADQQNMKMIGLFDRVNPETCIEGFCGDDSYDMIPQCYTSKRAACFDFSTPDTIRFFDDGIYNGFEYVYGVSSFDYGNTAMTSPANSSQVMAFSPRWDGDEGSDFDGVGNASWIQVNKNAAPDVAVEGGEIYVYPNPLRLGIGISDYEGSKVIFTNLPTGSQILVFTPAGDKVIELGPELQEGANIHWDTRNSEGAELTAGVFLYKVIMTEREDFWSKLIIIR